MMGQIPHFRPVGAAFRQRHSHAMQTVLHLGSHRTGSTTFQAYLRDHSASLAGKGLVFWDPRRTRNGLFDGLMPKKPGSAGAQAQRQAEGRIRMNRAKVLLGGAEALLVSDENMIGSVRANMRAGQLYPAIGERMARVMQAFAGDVDRIVLTIRSQDRYWASALAYGVARGAAVPSTEKIARIAASTRTWRDVITDLACAAPDVDICVIPFENFYANPETLLGEACGLPTARAGAYDWLNSAPSLPKLRAILAEHGDDPASLPEGQGRWEPFTRAQRSALQEQFEDDLFWLAAGAEGLARLTEKAMPGERGKAHRTGATRGHEDDKEGSLERTG